MILWRHAEAETGGQALARNLTQKGQAQAHDVAGWLHVYLPDPVRILCSPANRARQTADALALPYEVTEFVARGCNLKALRAATGWPHGDGTVILVEHNPAMSGLANRLLASATVPISLRTGSLLWLSSQVRGRRPVATVEAAMEPALLTRA